ncbi:MAG: T9SS type A sorting domain-containing protein [Candidatus Hatepunaea meridiana]|nr:T9SS type A sorting domain-containing protein [Candidatus Hatepunaea meridiana]
MRIVLVITLLLLLQTTIPVARELNVHFNEGQNLISINITPTQDMYAEGEDRGPGMELMFEQLSPHVINVKDDMGSFYKPSWGWCGIAYWDLTKAYQVHVDEDITATWEGEPIPADTDIPLESGWNMIAYYPNYELDASAPDFYVLSLIIEYVIYAYDGDGGYMKPDSGISNMEPWRPGKGYQIKVSEDVVLNYPQEQSTPGVSNTPTTFYLSPSFPNPFNSTTTIKYGISKPGVILLQVFDLTGRSVATIFEGIQNVGNHSTDWNALNAPAGIYIFQLQTANQALVSSGLLVR